MTSLVGYCILCLCSWRANR